MTRPLAAEVELAKKEADELARAEAKAKKESAPGRLLGMFKRPGVQEAANKAEQDARAAGASAEACGKHRRTTRRIETTPWS